MKQIKTLNRNVFLAVAVCFMLVNCQKPSARLVRSQVPNGKPTTATYPPCSEQAVKTAKDRSDIVGEIKTLVKDSESHELDAAQKTKLEKLITDLKPAADQLYAEIKKIKQGSAPAVGCSAQDPENASKKISYVTATLKLEDSALGKKVAAILKKPNPLSEDGTPNASTPSSDRQDEE